MFRLFHQRAVAMKDRGKVDQLWHPCLSIMLILLHNAGVDLLHTRVVHRHTVATLTLMLDKVRHQDSLVFLLIRALLNGVKQCQHVLSIC